MRPLTIFIDTNNIWIFTKIYNTSWKLDGYILKITRIYSDSDAKILNHFIKNIFLIYYNYYLLFYSCIATGDDMWDDYCYVCSQGCDETTGSLGCCESCPRVFHTRCHVPKILGLMEDLPLVLVFYIFWINLIIKLIFLILRDDWRCSICLNCEPLTQQTQEFGGREQLVGINYWTI